MSQRKPKNIFDNLGDLPSSKTRKASSSGPSLVLGKRPASPINPHEPEKVKDPFKLVEVFDPTAAWSEGSGVPLLPLHPSSFSGQKSPLKSFPLGEGITESPSLAMIMGKSALLPFDMNMHSSLSNDELVSTGAQHCLLVHCFRPLSPFFYIVLCDSSPSFPCYFRGHRNGLTSSRA